MKSERDAAVRAVARFAAITAKQRRGKPAPVQKQNCLLAFFQTISNRGSQLFRQDRGCLFLPAFLAKIDNAHERHLLFVHALGENGQPIFARARIVITLQRRRGAAQNHHAFLDLRPHHCDIARVIPRRLFLFVGGLVFFIDNDEPEIFQRSKNGAARADYDPGAPGMDFVPFIVALAFR